MRSKPCDRADRRYPEPVITAEAPAMKPLLTRIIALLFAAAPCVLADVAPEKEPDSATYANCMDSSGGVTSAMLDCMTQETALHDLSLNRAYQAALTSLGVDSARQLRSAQRAWIKFRDAECALHGRLTGGSIDRLNGGACMLDMTRERARQLQQLTQPDA